MAQIKFKSRDEIEQEMIDLKEYINNQIEQYSDKAKDTVCSGDRINELEKVLKKIKGLQNEQ